MRVRARDYMVIGHIKSNQVCYKQRVNTKYDLCSNKQFWCNNFCFHFFTLKIFMALTANSFGNCTGSNCWKFTTTKSLKCYGQRCSSSFGRRWNDSTIKSSCSFTTICIITATIAFDKCSAWNNRFPWWTIYF